MTEQDKKKRTLRVAIQGGYGAFHEIAARKYYSDRELTIVPCDTFIDLFDSVAGGGSDAAVVAIENSVAGSLIPNYALLSGSGLTVTGEVYLRIVQNLIGLPGQKQEDITQVHSHPMAILQCQEYLAPMRSRGVKVIESIDTALSAKWISENRKTGVAALASDLAAGMYGLEIIAASIESNKRNFTRFLIAEPVAEHVTEPGIDDKGKHTDKASVCFTLPHAVGSLSQVLSVFAFYRINLSKIQSLPVVGKEWEYFFYLDLLYDDVSMYKKSLEAVKPLIDKLQILGEYRAGERNNEKI
ncbi:MAG: prephenate dehydratase [Marinilabiliales bacterium]|nr:MAG: prephenate dehydratase [Marinilabiliales bacterium]